MVADTFSVEEGTGIARYSLELLTGLSNLGLNVRPLRFSPPNILLGSAINHGLRMPFAIARLANGFDLIHATSPICALAFPFVCGSKKIVTYHDLVSLLCKETSNAFYTRLFAPLFLRVGKLADRIIADSYQTKDEMIAHLGIPGDKISVVNLGVKKSFKVLRREPREGFTIGYVGALTRRKRVDFLIEAFRLLKEKFSYTKVKLVICGGKTLEYPKLKKLAAELNVSNDVEFRGFVVEEHKLAEAYNSFDVFVLPSEWEGFGMPILEAQRCGVPVVIRQDAHIPLEVSKYCLKANSEEDMADKISELLTNTNLRETTIEQGLEYSRQFPWEKTVQGTLSVYKEALEC